MNFVITHYFIKDNITEAMMSPHVAYLKELLEQGILIITGPFIDEKRGGMFIVEVKDEEELNLIVNNDPAILSGLARYKARPYKIVFQRN